MDTSKDNKNINIDDINKIKRLQTIKNNLIKKSLEKSKIGDLKKKKIVLTKKGTAVVASLLTASITIPATIHLVPHFKYIGKNYKIEKANEFMEDVMPYIFGKVGCNVYYVEDGKCYVDNLTKENIYEIKDILVKEYGFTDGAAELAFAEYYNFQDDIYLLRGHENARSYYYSGQYYVNQDDLLNDETAVFVNMNEGAYVSRVNELQNELNKGSVTNER